MQKLFGRGNFFKCFHCNKLTYALDKLEINPTNHSNNLQKGISTNNNSFYKTPTKPFVNNTPINSLRCMPNNNYSLNQNCEEERKENNANNAGNNNKMLSNFINEFNMINLALNSNKNENPHQSQNCPNSHNNYTNNTISINNNNENSSNIINRTLVSSSSVNNFKTINDFPFMKSRRRLNKKYCLNGLNETFLGKKRDESNMKSEFRGYNKSKEKNNINNKNKNIFGTTKPKRLISKNMSKICKTENNINNNLTTSSNIELGKVVNDFKRENCDLKNIFLNNHGSYGFPLFNDNNLRSNLFLNKSGIIGQNANGTIDNSTPNRIYNNTDDRYF
jgi:hypothetical protein